MNINLRLLEKKLKDLDNDNLKINLFAITIADSLRRVILNSLSSDENRLKCLKYASSDSFIMDILLPSLESSESKLTAIGRMSFVDFKLNAIEKYLNDELKLKCLDFFTTVNYKTKLIQSLEDDNLKIDYLNYIDDIFFRNKVLESIKDEEVLERVLKTSSEDVIIRILKNCTSDELKLKYLKSISKDIDKASVITTFKSDEFKIKEINNLSDEKSKETILNSLSKKEMILDSINLLNSKSDIVNFISKFNFALVKEIRNKDYLLDIFSSYYSVPLNHLKVFLDRFGYNLFSKLSSSNIKTILRFNEEDFQKFIKLFDKDNIILNDKVVNNICFKITSKMFDIECKDVKNIFHEMLNCIATNNKVMFYNSLNTMLKSFDKEELSQVLIENNIDVNIFKNIFDDIQNKTNSNYYIDVIHLISIKYVENERNKYIDKNLDLFKDKLNKRVKLNKKYVVNKKVNALKVDVILTNLEEIRNKLTEEENELLNNKDLFIKCINFKKNTASINESDRKIVEKNLRLFDEIIYKRYGYINVNFSKDSYIKEYPDAVFDEEYKTVRNVNLLDIIDNINLGEFVSNVLPEEEVYDELLHVLKEYKILGFADTFNDLFKLIDVEYNNNICSNIISNYKEFKGLYSSSRKDLLELLYNAELRGESDLKYKILFKNEDYNLIVKDPQTNSSYLGKQKRLRYAVGKIKLMYSNKYLTIPSFDEEINVNGKKLNVIVGNRTNPRNLTLGERTSSCMRIGREAETLFNFCLCNPNGFHIVFLDPDTKGFVSRVSGFRNGNSIFLNQLRSSVSVKYQDKDLAVALEEVCNKIVDICEKSNDKIDYVFITDDFAMKNERKPNTSFSEDITKGYDNVYNNLKSGAVILYKREGFPKSRAKLNLYNVESKYPVIRDKVKEYYNADAEYEAQRIEMINDILNGKEFSKIKTEFKKVIYLISGEDWYIGLDASNNLIEYIIDVRKDDERAKEEMSYYKNIILEKSNYIMKNDEVKGL